MGAGKLGRNVFNLGSSPDVYAMALSIKIGSWPIFAGWFEMPYLRDERSVDGCFSRLHSSYVRDVMGRRCPGNKRGMALNDSTRKT